MKSKPIVQIYARKTATGQTIYLHYTINGRQVRESTGLRLTGDKQADKLTQAAAVKLQADRTADILAGKTGIKTDSLKDKILLIDYCRQQAAEYESRGMRSSSNLTKALINHLSNYKPKARLIDIDKTFCSGFYKYLKTAQATNHRKAAAASQERKTLKATAAETIYTRLIAILNKAVKQEIITANAAAKIDREKEQQQERCYMTESEIKQFAAAAVADKLQETKKAFLFSFLTGLRFSDIITLTAENFEETAAGLRLKVLTQKTKKFISYLLPPDAAAVIADRLKNGSLIFNLKANSNVNDDLVKITAAAGITGKHITFHTARHTFATMLLTKGADIYTISTMLGHSKLTTTQIYAKIVDKKKDDAAQLLGGILN